MLDKEFDTFSKQNEEITPKNEEKTPKNEEESQASKKIVLKRIKGTKKPPDNYGIARFTHNSERRKTIFASHSSDNSHITENSQSLAQDLKKRESKRFYVQSNFDSKHSKFDYNNHEFYTSKTDFYDINQTNPSFCNEMNQTDKMKKSFIDRINGGKRLNLLKNKGSSLNLMNNGGNSPKQKRNHKRMTYEEYMEVYYPKIKTPKIKETINSYSNIAKIYGSNQITTLINKNSTISSQK